MVTEKFGNTGVVYDNQNFFSRFWANLAKKSEFCASDIPEYAEFTVDVYFFCF